MKKFIITILACTLLFCPTAFGQKESSFALNDLAALKSGADPVLKYHEILKLNHEISLSEDVAVLLIRCLSDLRGETPGNTIAGAAAEILANHPNHAKRALPELIELLAYTEQYALPSGSAAKAIRSIKRIDLETYIKNFDKGEKQKIAKNLSPVLDNRLGDLYGFATISMVLGMLGEESAIPALKSISLDAKKQKNNNAPFKEIWAEIEIRADAAINIIKNKWNLGEKNYLIEMKSADTLLGKPDQYVSIDDLFSQALKILSLKMNESGAKTAYIIRKDALPFDSVSNGIPMARLSEKGEWAYLFTRAYMDLRIFCRARMVVSNRITEKAYSTDLSDGGMQPSHFPKTCDYAFIEMGVNGRPLLDETLKSLMIKEGFQQDLWYEFWPDEWWDEAATILQKKLNKDERLVWIKVADGKIVKSIVGRKL